MDGNLIELRDLFIAASALAHDLPLATLNIKHFERVDGLVLVEFPGAIPGSSIVVSPTITTTYTWSVANAFGCNQTQTLTLNVTDRKSVV